MRPTRRLTSCPGQRVDQLGRGFGGRVIGQGSDRGVVNQSILIVQHFGDGVHALALAKEFQLF